MVVLNKKFYSRKKDLENQGDNVFSRASKNLSTLTPIIFGLILAPTVVVSSIMSQAAFLMIANILLSLGLTLAFLNRIYQGNAKILEVVLTLGMITALFFLVFYLSPAIAGLDFLAVITYINLFSSSINAFFLLRPIVLPPVLALIHYVLSKLGINVDIHLDKQRDFEVVVKLEEGKKSDSSATDLLNKNYTFVDSKTLHNNEWRQKAIAPYNHSKDLLYVYVTNYRSLPFGAINNYEKISKCLRMVDNLVIDGATDTSHNVFFKNKLIRKSQKIKFMHDDMKKLQEYNPESNRKNIKNIENFVKLRFRNLSKKSAQEVKIYSELLASEIQRQMNKIVNLLRCYPLHLAIKIMDENLQNFLDKSQIKELREKIATQENLSLYPKTELQKLGFFSEADGITISQNGVNFSLQ